jgi:hypothetical protein
MIDCPKIVSKEPGNALSLDNRDTMPGLKKIIVDKSNSKAVDFRLLACENVSLKFIKSEMCKKLNNKCEIESEHRKLNSTHKLCKKKECPYKSSTGDQNIYKRRYAHIYYKEQSNERHYLVAFTETNEDPARIVAYFQNAISALDIKFKTKKIVLNIVHKNNFAYSSINPETIITRLKEAFGEDIEYSFHILIENVGILKSENDKLFLKFEEEPANPSLRAR